MVFGTDNAAVAVIGAATKANAIDAWVGVKSTPRAKATPHSLGGHPSSEIRAVCERDVNVSTQVE